MKTTQPYLGIPADFRNAFRGVELSKSGRPGSGRSDVQAQRVLVGGRGQSEGVVLGGAQRQTSNPHPLPGPVVKVFGSLELEASDPCTRVGERKRLPEDLPSRHKLCGNITSESHFGVALKSSRL